MIISLFYFCSHVFFWSFLFRVWPGRRENKEKKCHQRDISCSSSLHHHLFLLCINANEYANSPTKIIKSETCINLNILWFFVRSIYHFILWEISHLDASPPPSKGFGSDIGRDEVAVAHSPRSAEEVCQPVSHAGRCVAGSLLCCNAASGEQKGLPPRSNVTFFQTIYRRILVTFIWNTNRHAQKSVLPFELERASL